LYHFDEFYSQSHKIKEESYTKETWKRKVQTFSSAKTAEVKHKNDGVKANEQYTR